MISFSATLVKIDPDYLCLEPYLPEHLGKGHLWPEGGGCGMGGNIEFECKQLEGGFQRTASDDGKN